MPAISDIIAAIETAAPLTLQESWDNSGLQAGPTDCECTGVMVCVDITPEVIDAAITSGCNFVVSHHPLLFRPIKQVAADTLLYRAIRGGLTVYSAHTSLDNAPAGVSHAMAECIGTSVTEILAPQAERPDCGTGVICTLSEPTDALTLVERLRSAFNLGGIRCSIPTKEPISRVALVGGAGGSFIGDAVAAGAQAIVTGDIRHHDFVDYASKIFMIDITHFDSEKCAKDIIMRIISEKFANFVPLISGPDTNPIQYL